jgi:hypothetical protein
LHKSKYLETTSFFYRFIHYLVMKSVDRPPSNPKRLTIESSQEVFSIDISRRTRSSSSAHQDDIPQNQEQNEPQPAPIHRVRRKALACRLKRQPPVPAALSDDDFMDAPSLKRQFSSASPSPPDQISSKKLKVPSPQVPTVKRSPKYNIIAKQNSPKKKSPVKSQVICIYFMFIHVLIMVPNQC